MEFITATDWLEWRDMATLGSSAADRLLRLYLKALRDSNSASQEYVYALQSGAGKPIRSKASAARGMLVTVRAAREAFQHTSKKHGSRAIRLQPKRDSPHRQLRDRGCRFPGEFPSEL